MPTPDPRPVPSRKAQFAGPGRLGKLLLFLLSAAVLIRIAVDVVETYGW
jgi:hypothetical protein